jgi:hypothetical protein
MVFFLFPFSHVPLEVFDEAFTIEPQLVIQQGLEIRTREIKDPFFFGPWKEYEHVEASLVINVCLCPLLRKRHKI